MLGRISRWRSELVRRRLERRAIKALALHSRGEARADGLSLRHLGCYLKIDWFARRIHPWYRSAGLPLQEVAQMFAEQCLEDADSALARLFRNIPQADNIEFRVLHPDTGSVIMAGAVTRGEAGAVNATSAGMKLKQMGVRYHLSDWRFEPLP